MNRRPPKPEGVESNPRFRKRKNQSGKEGQTQVAFADIVGRLMKIIHGRGFAFADPSLDDRTVAILASSHIEEFLRVAIITRGRHLPRVDTDRAIFRANGGALSTFSNRIRVADMMGLLTYRMFDDLEKIRWIRNEFAHAIEPRSFDDPDIAAECKKLEGRLVGRTLAKPIARETARRFVETSGALLAQLLADIEKDVLVNHFLHTHRNELAQHIKPFNEQFEQWMKAAETAKSKQEPER